MGSPVLVGGKLRLTKQTSTDQYSAAQTDGKKPKLSFTVCGQKLGIVKVYNAAMSLADRKGVAFEEVSL